MTINLNKKLVTKELLLKHVLDIEIYLHYSKQNVVIKKPMLSPLRTELTPSFGYFMGESGEICFNDFKLGKGDCIKFVQIMFDLNYFEALSKIVIDFKLTDKFYYKNLKSNHNKPITKIDYSFRESIIKKNHNIKLGKKKRDWKLYDLVYWQQYGINLDILNKYKVEPIEYIFINDKPILADKYTYCFTEFKDGNKTYKIYQPFNKEFKWLNNHDSSVWQGWKQLPEKGDELIITKSLKDVMSIDSILGIPAVSLQSEGTKPKPHIIQELKNRFKTIYLLYDNDFDKEKNWGQIFAKELYKEFDMINLMIPSEFESKDFSDLVKNVDNFEIGILTTDEIAKKKTLKEKITLIWQCNIQMPF